MSDSDTKPKPKLILPQATLREVWHNVEKTYVEAKITLESPIIKAAERDLENGQKTMKEAYLKSGSNGQIDVAGRYGDLRIDPRPRQQAQCPHCGHRNQATTAIYQILTLRQPSEAAIEPKRVKK
jgi:hypothetical protein